MLKDWLSVVDSSWMPFVETQQALLEKIAAEILKVSEIDKIVPAPANILRCFSLPIESIKVVIVGQDPYPNQHHACGLAFAMGDLNSPLPKSLQNIKRELLDDLGCADLPIFDLSKWQSAGVLLLNRILSAEEGISNSHRNLGWETFTFNLLTYLNSSQRVVAILWGNASQELKSIFNESDVLCSAHPSPLSAYRGFFGSRPFSSANQILIKHGLEPVQWCGALLSHE
jgi:uracil-DNA glycosylase